MENIAIILHMGETGLGITRSLARSGIDVYGVDWNREAIGFYSKFCKKRYVFAHPVKNPEKCIGELIELGRRLDHKAVLMPAYDYYVTLISKFNKELSDYFLYNIPEPSVVETIVDKRRQYEIAQLLGVPVPMTLSPSSMEEVIAHQELFNYPLVIKGASSYHWVSEFRKKAFVANCFDDLKAYYALASSKGLQVVIQEMILGPNKNHFKVCAYYSQEKQLLALFCTQKTRQFPIDFGIGTFMRSVNSPELSMLGQKFFDGIGYTGIGSIEFKKDEKDGNYKLIELNPRFWQQNIQATYAGINFPYINYLDCIGIQVEQNLKFKEGISWVALEEDFRSFLANRKRGEISLSKWLKFILLADCHEHYSRDDLKPSWIQLKRLVRRFLKYLISRLLHRIFCKSQ
jgi:D-aspartate ligase